MQPGYELAGRYVLERLLGQGAVGEVWRAADPGLDRAVAVKVIREIADPKLAEGLLREARIAARLHHPGITVVHDVGEHEGQPFIVMELLVGRDLDAVLATRPGGLPVGEAVSLAIQAADALAAAHAGGVVHRDLKPANLFLQDSGQLKICDFGIAVAAETTSSLALLSYLVGTPTYMSPEQCDGREAGEPGDLYSLGCVLYALLTGRPPFTSGPPLAIMAQHRTAVPAAVRERRPAMPAGLDRLVTDLLAKDPVARPVGAGQVAAALRALQGEIYAPGEGKPTANRPAKAPDDAVRLFDSAGPDAAPRDAAAWADQAPTAAVPRAMPRYSGSAVDPDALSSWQLLATAGSDGVVWLWDPATGQQVGALVGHERAVSAVCPVAVSGRLLLATASSDRTVRLWDPAVRQQVCVLKGHQRVISAVCPVVVGGRQLLAIAGSDRTVRLWDPVVGQQVCVLKGHQRAVSAVCPVVVGGRQLLATAGIDGTVWLWDLATGQSSRIREGYERKFNAMCSVAIGGRHLLATADNDRTVQLWDPATRRQTAMMRADDWPYEISGICSVTVGERLLLATGSSGGVVRVWDPATGQQTVRMLRDPDWDPPTPGPVTGLCSVTVLGWSLLATSHRNGVVHLWDPATGHHATALRGHRYRINAVCPVTVGFQEPMATVSDDRGQSR